MEKKNCWEFMGCGRITGGAHEKDLGICPVYHEASLDKVHSGRNAGRACWVVAGTLCGGRIQGSFAQKYEKCELCAFYQKVRIEEGAKYHLAILLLKQMREQLV